MQFIYFTLWIACRRWMNSTTCIALSQKMDEVKVISIGDWSKRNVVFTTKTVLSNTGLRVKKLYMWVWMWTWIIIKTETVLRSIWGLVLQEDALNKMCIRWQVNNGSWEWWKWSLWRAIKRCTGWDNQDCSPWRGLCRSCNL